MKRSPLGPGASSIERGSTFKTPRSELKRTGSLEGSASLRRTTASSLKRGAISPASKAQRAKARTEPCIVTGATELVDPAHLWPRGNGGCNHPDCIVTLRRDQHRAFDDGQLDLLPYLIARGRWRELAHMVEAHHVDPVSMIQRLSGVRYVPEDATRIVRVL